MNASRGTVTGAIIIAALVVSLSTHAGDEPPGDGNSNHSNASEAMVDPTLTIDLPPTPVLKHLWDRPEYQITLRNTGIGKLIIQSVKPRFLQSSLRDALGQKSDEMDDILGPGTHSLGPNSDLNPPAKICLPEPKISWAWLTFTPGKYELEVVANYNSISDPNQKVHTTNKTFEILLAPDYLAIVTGAVAGCLTLVVSLSVFGAYKYVVKMNAEQVGRITPIPIKDLLRFVPPLLLENTLLFLAGSVAACIAVFLAETTNDLQIIMSIQVHDARGGFVLGFLSIPLIDVVFRFAQGQMNRSTS